MITEMKAGHLKDIDKPSEPFEVIGKIIPVSYTHLDVYKRQQEVSVF